MFGMCGVRVPFWGLHYKVVTVFWDIYWGPPLRGTAIDPLDG